MKSITWVITDLHFFHQKLIDIKARPVNYQDLILKNWHKMVNEEDRIICLGDVSWKVNLQLASLLLPLPGYKILIRGNHDRGKKCYWWMNNGFHFCCDGFRENNVYFSHEPVDTLPDGCDINIHGHLHQSWNSHHQEYIKRDFQRLVSLEENNYKPIRLGEIL